MISSRSKICGSLTTVRTKATRCFWPPERSAAGCCHRSSDRPHCARNLRAAQGIGRAAPCRETSSAFGRLTQPFSATGEYASAGLRAQRLGRARRRGMETKRLHRDSNVLLPAPEGPTTVTTVPRGRVAELPCNTGTVDDPRRNDLVTSSNSSENSEEADAVPIKTSQRSNATSHNAGKRWQNALLISDLAVHSTIMG